MTPSEFRRLRAAAGDPATAPEELTRLVGDPDRRLARVAAANPSLPESSITEAVHEAMREGDEHLLDRLAGNPSLPRSLMFEIAHHGWPRCRKALAANPNADIEVLTAIRERDESQGFSRSRMRTLINIVKHPACNIKLIREIFDAGVGITPVLMAHCLEHTDLSADIIDEIAEGRTEILPSCNPRTYIYIPNRSDVKMLRESIAAHPNTPPLLLALLARQPNPQVAGIASANPSLPKRTIVEAVGEAAQSRSRCLYCRLARDPSLHKDVIFEIVRHGSLDCLKKLASNPNAELDMLTAIYQKAISDVDIWRRDGTFAAIAKNPACSVDLAREIFERVAGDTFVELLPDLLSGCMANSDLPTHIIDKIAEQLHDLRKFLRSEPNHEWAEVRRELMEVAKRIAEHSNTSLLLLTLLAMDPDPRLAEPALKRIRQRRRSDPNLVDNPPPTRRSPTTGAAEADVPSTALPEQTITEAVHEAMRSSALLLGAFARSPNLPKDAMFEIVRHGNLNCLTELAGNPSADIEVLAAIREADKSGGYTRSRRHTLINIVKHPACNIQLIRDIFDARVGITPDLMASAMNYSDLPSDIIDKIAKRLHKLLARLGTPKNRAQAAAKDDLAELQKSIAAHPNTSLALLTVYAMGPDPQLAKPALKRIQRLRRSNPAPFEGSQAAERDPEG